MVNGATAVFFCVNFLSTKLFHVSEIWIRTLSMHLVWIVLKTDW